MTNRKRQHYVPKFYLKEFATKKNNSLFVFDKSNNSIFEKNISEICEKNIITRLKKRML
jgi:hypothetical protein